jgi:Chaperone of endosialidase
MSKILTGSTLSYGPILPDPSKTADGSMFFLTSAYADPITSPSNSTGVIQNRTPGLHIYSFQQDSSALVLGDQVGQQWKQVSSLAIYVATTGDTMTGDLIIQSGGPYKGLRLLNVAGNGGGSVGAQVGSSAGIVINADAGPIAFTAGSTLRMTLQTTGNLQLITAAGTANVWTNLNDGPSSGMDADLLDSQDGAFYLNSANHTGVISLARGGTAVTTTTPGGIVYGGAGQLSTSGVGVAGQLLQSGASAAPTWINPSAITVASANQLTTAHNITLSGNATGSASFNGTADATINVTVLDSQKLGGLSPSSAVGANTVVVRDGSGYTFGTYFNSATPNSESAGAAIAQIITTNGSDAFYRKASLASVAASIGLGNYVLKSGDSLTGQLNVNGINLIYSTNSINVPGSGTFGSIIASGAISASGALSGASLAVTGAVTGASGAFTGEVTAYASDGRLKENVTIITNAMEKIGTLGGYEYDWKMEESRRLGFTPTHKHEHGLIAQEVAKVLPDAVTAAGFNSDYLTVKYERLIALLVAGMNEQQAQINALITEVEDLKNQR